MASLKPKITFQRVSLDQLSFLRNFILKTFLDAFADQNTKEDINIYVEKSISLSKIKEELENPNSHFYFAFIDNILTAYLKLNFLDAQSDNLIDQSISMEIERIYVIKDAQSNGIGKSIIEFADQIAEEKKLSVVWLGVWEKNTKAINFYKRHGFTKFATHNFMLGNDLQTDWLMSKTI